MSESGSGGVGLGAGAALSDDNVRWLRKSTRWAHGGTLDARMKAALKKINAIPDWNDLLLRRVAIKFAEVLTPAEIAAKLCLAPAKQMNNFESNVDEIFDLLHTWLQTAPLNKSCACLLEVIQEKESAHQFLQHAFGSWRRDYEFLPGFIPDGIVEKIADNIGEDWKTLAFELHLTQEEVADFASGNLISCETEDGMATCENDGALPDKATLSEQAHSMLLYWRRTSGRYATRSTLAQALVQVQRPNLIDHLLAGTANPACELDLHAFVKELLNDASLSTGNAPSVRRRQVGSRQQVVETLRGKSHSGSSPAQFTGSGTQAANNIPTWTRVAPPAISSISPSSPSSEAAVKKKTPPMPPAKPVISASTKGKYFGVSIAELPPRSDGSRVPLFVDKCITYIEKRGLDREGLHRISGGKTAVNDLEARYTKDHNLNFASLPQPPFDVDVVASCFRSFLRKLPEPIVPAPILEKLADAMAIDDQEYKLERVRLIVFFGIPSAHRATLKVIVKHLHRVSQYPENKMTASNLAIVFWPTLMRPDFDFQDIVLINHLPGKLQKVVAYLVEFYEDVFLQGMPW